MKIALIHDWLDKYGGAERVITAITEKLEFDFYYAYVNRMDPRTQKLTFGNKEVGVIESSFLRPFKSHFRLFMPFFPLATHMFNRQTAGNKVDAVISSSWALSKSYRIGNEIHISYFQARNFKYVWDESHLYFTGFRKVFSFLKWPLRQYDIRSAQNPQYIVANSEFVKSWIRKKYNRDSHVIYPPVDVNAFSISEEKDDYYVTVGRLEPYKRFDIVVDTFNRNGKKLVIIGDGSQLRSLKAQAGKNITFTGFKSKEEIHRLLGRARAFVYAGVEDFGIVIVEALASGTPVIAYDGGASREIVGEKYANGLLYNEQTHEALDKALQQFEERPVPFSPTEVRASSLRFSTERFQKEFISYVEGVLKSSSDN